MFSLFASKRVTEALAELGGITLLAREAVLSLLKGRASWRDLLYQIYFIGVKSQSVVLITGAFTGMVLGAEIGTMRVTEQIDALRALATHPVDYLVVPRLVAAHVALPLLTVEAIAIGILGGYFVSVNVLDIEPTYLWANMLKYTHQADVVIGLIKAFIYGGIIALIGCYKGMTCRLGAEGVGQATTEAVVYASITILIANFFLTLVMGKLVGLL